MPKAVRVPTCPSCGSASIISGGSAVYDESSEQWVLESIGEGDFFCRDCEEEFETPKWKAKAANGRGNAKKGK
jgi:tRNA(Ile2) C34 agmatinyltransferase TiaS